MVCHLIPALCVSCSADDLNWATDDAVTVSKLWAKVFIHNFDAIEEEVVLLPWIRSDEA